MLEKPPKKVYADQKDAFEKFKEFILPYLKHMPEVKEAVVWASLAEGKFGTYEREHKGHTGSDVDLVILLEEGKEVPKEFKDLDVHKSWFDGYLDKKFRHFEYKGNNHEVDVLLIKRGKLEAAKERLKSRSKPIYLKKGEEKEL
jgi:predicted nucleotidyltransferase